MELGRRGGEEGKRSGVEAIARRLFPRHSCHGIPPDAILAEANRIQRKRSHVHTRILVRICMYACTYVCCVCIRVHTRECCRGTV